MVAGLFMESPNYPCKQVRQIINLSTLTQLETKLNDFALPVRTNALVALVNQPVKETPTPTAHVNGVNMHAHTFFSFNAYGHSPTSLAWLARKYGYQAIGTVDFDVLDAVDEFLGACDIAEVRGSCAIETRVYIPDFSTREINSPGEPGVAYHMGIGFTSRSASGTAAIILADMRKRASQRNRELIERINVHLQPVTIDYERDVLPLTPTGNATERHILVAYTQAVEKSKLDPVVFWAAKLDTKRDQIAAIIHDTPKLHNLIRARLMKKGGVGYVQPGPAAFPSVDEFHQFVIECEALPCAAWLDGTSTGEGAIEELLGLMINKGVVALNIIPDRNWNIADPAQKKLKLQNLYDVVKLARVLDLPLNVGTEMNAYGQKTIDDFDAPALAPVRQAFLDGAYFIYGHTVMQRALRLGYQSKWAQSNLPTRAQRNAFYIAIGRRIPAGKTGLLKLKGLTSTLTPDDLMADIG
jgi:hypothetical protein